MLLISVLALAAFLYLAICFGLARQYIYPRRTIRSTPEGLVEVEVETRHGATPSFATPGLLGPNPSRIAFLLVHGYGGSRSGQASKMFALADAGYDSVAPRMPGQDASPVPGVGFGPTESEVIADTVHWIKEKTRARVVLYGISLGGALCWLASDLSSDIDAIISESAFALFEPASKQYMSSRVPFAHIFLAPVIPMAAKMRGIDPKQIRPVDAAARWLGKAGLVIHAGQDRTIPRYHGQMLSEASGCNLWIVPDAVHSQCFGACAIEFIERLVKVAEAISSDTEASKI